MGNYVDRYANEQERAYKRQRKTQNWAEVIGGVGAITGLLGQVRRRNESRADEFAGAELFNQMVASPEGQALPEGEAGPAQPWNQVIADRMRSYQQPGAGSNLARTFGLGGDYQGQITPGASMTLQQAYQQTLRNQQQAKHEQLMVQIAQQNADSTSQRAEVDVAAENRQRAEAQAKIGIDREKLTLDQMQAKDAATKSARANQLAAKKGQLERAEFESKQDDQNIADFSRVEKEITDLTVDRNRLLVGGSENFMEIMFGATEAGQKILAKRVDEGGLSPDQRRKVAVDDIDARIKELRSRATELRPLSDKAEIRRAKRSGSSAFAQSMRAKAAELGIDTTTATEEDVARIKAALDADE